MNDCIAIAGGKGGCGKTTTTVGLGLALARLDRDPLLADTDHQLPDLHLVADVPDRPGLGAVAAGGDPRTVAHPLPDTPAVMALPAGDVGADEIQTGLARLGTLDRPVLLDCPAGAGRDAAVGLRAADRTLLVSTATRESLCDTAKTAAMARELGAPPLGVLLVDPPRDRKPPAIDADHCRRLFGCDRIGRVPRVADPPLTSSDVRMGYRKAAKKAQERNI